MYFLVAALLVLLSAACTNDHIDQDDDGIVTDPTGEAWIALNVGPPTTSFSRALPDPDKIIGTTKESNVKKIRAIFFDGSEKVTADKTFTVGTDQEAGNPNQPEGDQGKAGRRHRCAAGHRGPRRGQGPLPLPRRPVYFHYPALL